MTAIAPAVQRVTGRVRGVVAKATEGWADLQHRRTVLVLAGVLALDQADRASVGAMAPSLEHAFHIGNGDIGLLAGAFSIVGGLATVPVGVLTDRVRRNLLLAGSIVAWSFAMGVSGLAVSFVMLFAARLGLGVVTATGGPTIASLTGDLYPPRRRGQIMSYIESGELVGTGLGFLVTGAVIAVLSWRWVFHLLAFVGLALAYAAWRIPEPPRGERGGEGRRGKRKGAKEKRPIAEVLADAGVEPGEDVVLDKEPRKLSLWQAVRHVFRVRTNVIAIVAVSIGNFFFAGLKTFAVVFVVEQYGMSPSTASLLVPAVGVGALTGLVVGGWIGDRRLRQGHVNARINVGAVGYFLAPLMILPALFTRSVAVALPLYILAGAALTLPTPPLDAARLDIMPPGLWGRAEGVRTALRVASEAVAPILFGFLADNLAGGGRAGLQLTFLIMLPALVGSGAVILLARRSYGPDVLAAAESE